jgi:two-component system, OmpR family, response regulator VicR
MANAKTVVCIEDEPEMITLIKAILSRRGYEVVGAASGREGLEIVSQLKPDMVLLDLMMPGMDGWEVYQKLKANPETQNLPVIVVTAKAQSIDKMLGLHIAKVDDYIAKPFTPQELVESIEKVLAKRHAPAATEATA